MIERYLLPKMKAIWSDENKFKKMLDVEILSCEALSKLGKISKSDLAIIKKKARFNIDRIKQIEEKTKHDVVAFIENISENIGSSARFLHMGLTSNDILDTTLACQMKASGDVIIDDLRKLLNVISKKAKKYKYTPIVGRTHGVHAEPITFGLKLALFYDETKRNLERMIKAKETISFGKISGAVGTYANIEPYVEEYACKKLGIKPSPISTQVISRDRHAEFLSTLALIGTTLERFATEVRHLQRTEVSEAEEFFSKGQKGSSAMPHKRNPVNSERICGLARLLRANAQAALENVTLWHERDISHSSVERIIIPDSCALIDFMLNEITKLVDNLLVYPENMKRNLGLTRGRLFSQHVLLTLIERGLSRLDAYSIAQEAAMRSYNENKDFKEILEKDKRITNILSKTDLGRCFSLKYHMRFVDKIYRRVGI
ncbi:MAG: adenylosuccinate lyase [Candidatus Omnitrophica bacterium]|nr:adenylosuccinate lyase [Candidatus Omnitrophota bacterium]